MPEFKKWDIVKIMGEGGFFEIDSVGEYIRNGEITPDYHIKGCKYWADELILVCPAEKRLDLKGE